MPCATHTVWLIPIITLLSIYFVAERIFPAPAVPPVFVCLDPDQPPAACDPIPDPKAAVGACHPRIMAGRGTVTSLQECVQRLSDRLNETPTAQPQAQTALGATYAIALIFGAVLAIYSLVTTARFRHWGAAGIAGVIAGIASIAVLSCHLLPHQATRDLLGLLAAIPKVGTIDADRAISVARCGSGMMTALAVLYAAALFSIARPLPRNLDGVLDHEIEELAKRFERLTTLSYFGGLAFVLAMVTLSTLLQWPLVLAKLGPDLNNTEAALMTLFGAYLTAVLTSSYLPAATILEAQANCLAAKALSATPAQSLDAAMAAIPDHYPDAGALRAALNNWDGAVRAIFAHLEGAKAANPAMASRIAAALRDAGLDPAAVGFIRRPDDLAARLDWQQKRGLTVVSITRLGASLATLLPLLAGGSGISALIASLSK